MEASLLNEADKIAPSLIEQEVRFGKFCADMLDHTKDGGQVYMDYLNSNPTDAEIAAAQNVITKRAEIEKSMPKDETANQTRPNLTVEERKAHIILDMFVHHATSRDVEGALRDAEFKIQQDPELQNDKAFRGIVKNTAERLKGDHKNINKLNLNHHDGNFFHISKSGPARWHQHVGDEEMKKIMKNAMGMLYNLQGKMVPEHVDNTVEHIVKHRKVPVALAMAAHENQQAIEGVRGEMRTAHHSEHKHVGISVNDRIKFASERRKNLHPDVKYVNKDGIEYRESSRSSTETLQLVRELIRECCTGEESKYMVCRRISDSLKELGAKEELVKMALNFKDVENTEKNRTELLLSAYQICCPDGFKIEGYESGIAKESQQLAKGGKPLHDSAVGELMKNRHAHQHWKHYNEAPEVIKNSAVKTEQTRGNSIRNQVASNQEKGQQNKVEINGPQVKFNMGPQIN